MNQNSLPLERRFWIVFQRVLGTQVSSGVIAREDLESWDSLRHVELIFELEESFGVDISPEEIVALYSNTDVILEFIRGRAGEGD